MLIRATSSKSLVHKHRNGTWVAYYIIRKGSSHTQWRPFSRVISSTRLADQHPDPKVKWADKSDDKRNLAEFPREQWHRPRHLNTSPEPPPKSWTVHHLLGKIKAVPWTEAFKWTHHNCNYSGFPVRLTEQGTKMYAEEEAPSSKHFQQEPVDILRNGRWHTVLFGLFIITT